ncbi:MAG: hypothetical protein AAF562_10795 [Pseudomonadota bacterium]
MSEFALQFIPQVDPRTMSPLERAMAARQGLLPKPSKDTLQRVAESDEKALGNMGLTTGLRDQAMSGVNEGLAGFLGAPVDLMTTGINSATGAINNMTGANIPQIQSPVYGSEMFEDVLSPAISDVSPQTAGQRYARRIGQEVGFGAPAAMTLAGAPVIGPAARTNLPAYMGASTASDVAAGTSGQTAREIAPENDFLDFAATLAGGSAVSSALTRASRSRPAAPTREEIGAEASRLYDQTKGVSLTDNASAEYLNRLQQRLEMEGGDALSHPKASAQIRRVEKNPRMDVYGIEQSRRKIRDNVARNADEGAMGRELLSEIEGYLDSLTPQDITSGNADEAVNALRQARAAAHTGYKHDTVSDALDNAVRRTERSGTAGNVLNNTTQEIEKIYRNEVSRSNPQKSAGYSPDEVAKMEEIVFPSTYERNLQRLGRLSPTTGAHSNTSLLGGGAGITAAATTGNPLFYAAAAPPAVGMIAETLARRAKNKHTDELVDIIARGGAAEPKKSSEALRAALVAQLLTAGQR